MRASRRALALDGLGASPVRTARTSPARVTEVPRPTCQDKEQPTVMFSQHSSVLNTKRLEATKTGEHKTVVE